MYIRIKIIKTFKPGSNKCLHKFTEFIESLKKSSLPLSQIAAISLKQQFPVSFNFLLSSSTLDTSTYIGSINFTTSIMSFHANYVM